MSQKSADVSKISSPFSKIQLVSSMVFMMLGLLIGIFRLMNFHGIAVYPSVLARLYEVHPNIMIFGFLAPIIMNERFAGTAVLNLPAITRSASRLMVPLTQLGLMLQIASYLVGLRYLASVGSLFIVLGLLSFTILLTSLSGKTGIRLPFYFMILSVLPLEVFSFFTFNSGFISNSPEAVLLLLFPIFFILGERIELTRFTTPSYSESRFRLAYFGCIGSLIFTALAVSYYVYSGILMSLSFLTMVLVAVSVLLDESRNFRKVMGSSLPLQKYVITHVAVSYFWLMAGSIFGISYFSLYLANSYDAMIHSMAVGFIGTMLLAHGPVILPSLLKRGPAKPSLFPLLILTISNGLRIAGDFYFQPSFSILSGISGWLILAAVLLFIRSVFFSSRKISPSSGKK